MMRTHQLLARGPAPRRVSYLRVWSGGFVVGFTCAFLGALMAIAR